MIIASDIQEAREDFCWCNAGLMCWYLCCLNDMPTYCTLLSPLVLHSAYLNTRIASLQIDVNFHC